MCVAFSEREVCQIAGPAAQLPQDRPVHVSGESCLPYLSVLCMRVSE